MERNIRTLVAVYVLGSLQFHQPVFALLFTLAKGLTLREFFLIESAYFLTMTILELPTGSFSDRVSRTRALLIGAALAVPSTLAMIVADSLPILIAASVVGGIGSAFWSGTDSALLYDSLLAAGREKEFKTVSGRMRWYGGWAMGIACIIGGLLAGWNLAYAWWAWLAASVAVLALVATLREPTVHGKKEHREGYLFHVRASVRHGFGGPAGYFVLFASVVWLFFSLGYWLWQPYLTLTGLPTAWFGAVYLAMNVISGFVSKHTESIEERLGMGLSLLLVPLLLALGFLLESQVIAIYGFLFLSLQSVASGYFAPLLDDYLHTRIPTERRATVLSLKNMLTGLLFSVFSPLIGYHADVVSLPATLLLMAGTLAVVALAFRAWAPSQS